MSVLIGKANGYAHARYAASLAEFGVPRQLPRSRGWVLERQIPGTPYKDAMGCYPLFSCEDWSKLATDLHELEEDLVSLTLIPAPFDNYDHALLERCFDHVAHYKDHYVADLSSRIDTIVKRSHRRTIRRANREIEVHLCDSPSDFLDNWLELFANLANRHGIRGLRAFSKTAFSMQLNTPGLVMFEAWAEGVTVGLDLWYVQDDVAYGHLVAFSDLGYKLRASYATKWHLLNFVYGKVRWIECGGAADIQDSSDGLTRFKEGWTKGVRPAYLCGRIFHPMTYHQLAVDRQTGTRALLPPIERAWEHEPQA